MTKMMKHLEVVLHRHHLFFLMLEGHLEIHVVYVLSGLAKVQGHRYVLFNCLDVNPYLRYYLKLIKINSTFS
jgi:hypothetical protein